MNNIFSIVGAMLIGAALVLGGIFIHSGYMSQGLGGDYAVSIASLTNATSSVATSIGLTSVNVLDADSSRQYVRIQNLTGTDVSICYSATSTCQYNLGYVLTSKSILEINQDNLYKGAISAIASSTGAGIINISYK